jgi:hypothetical protein
MYEVEFDWFDENHGLETDKGTIDLGVRHEKLRIDRSRTSVEEIYSLVKREYPTCRNVKIKIVKK